MTYIEYHAPFQRGRIKELQRFKEREQHRINQHLKSITQAKERLARINEELLLLRKEKSRDALLQVPGDLARTTPPDVNDSTPEATPPRSTSSVVGSS